MAAGPEDLLDRAVAALVREWDVDPTEARESILRLRVREARLGQKVAREWTWAPYPDDVRVPAVVDLTAAEAREEAR